MTLPERVALFERRAILRILRKTGGNVVKAAALAGYNRTAFFRLLRQHGIPRRYKKPSALYTTLAQVHRTPAKRI